MKDRNVKFYVIIPVYNTEDFVGNCIESVLNQTYENFQIIAVDDGSPDMAGRICDDYSKKDSRISVIHQENAGQISARYAGIHMAKKSADYNDYFVFVDSDDTLESNSLEVIYQTVKAKNSDIVFFEYNRVFRGQKQNDTHEKAWFVGDVSDKRELYKTVFSDARYNSMCIKSIRCDIVDEIDYTDFYYLRLGEDLLHSIPIYKKCNHVTFIGDRLYNYTINPNSVTQTQTHKNYKVDSTVRKTVWDFLQAENCFTESDFEEYLLFSIQLLRSKIIKILFFDIGYEKKAELLDCIKKDDYYSMLLSHPKANDHVLLSVKKGRIRHLVFLCNVRKRLGKIYRLFKKK